MRILKYLYHLTYDVEVKNVAIRLHEKNPAAKLLDCGCGSGEYTTRIANQIGTKDIWGIEIDGMLARESASRDINVVCSDLGEKWKFEDNSFDVLHASGIIDHLFNTDMFLEESYRVLKLGGYLLVLNNNLSAYHHILSLLLGRQPAVAHISEKALIGTLGMDGEHWGLLGPQRLKRSFTTYGMMKLLEYYGYTIEKVVGVGFYPLPPKLARFICKLDRQHSAYFVIKARK